MARIDRLDLNLFRVLDAIYSTGGVGAAARVLNLTQPAVTHALGRLRTALDDPLFVRQGARLRPTPRTIAMMPSVQSHLSGLLAAAQANFPFDPRQLDMTFGLGMRDALETFALPTIIDELTADAPQVRVFSRRVVAEDIERSLETGAVDLVIDRAARVGARIASQDLGEDVLVVLMRRGHPLSQRMGRAAYLSAEHIAVAEPGEVSTLDVLLDHGGADRHVRATCQNHVSACRMVAQSDLLLTAPRSYTRGLRALFDLDVADLPIRLKPFTVTAYWRRLTDEDEAQVWFRGCVIKILGGDLANGAPAFPAGASPRVIGDR